VFKEGSLESTLNSILWVAGKIRHNVNAIAETSQARVAFATQVFIQLIYLTLYDHFFLWLSCLHIVNLSLCLLNLRAHMCMHTCKKYVTELNATERHDRVVEWMHEWVGRARKATRTYRPFSDLLCAPSISFCQWSCDPMKYSILHSRITS
jgi:hypothetical protein